MKSWGVQSVNDGLDTYVSGLPIGWTSNSNLYSEYHTEWATVDLGSSFNISRVDLFPRGETGYVGAGFPVDFTIKVSTDDVNWTTVIARTNYPLPGAEAQSFTFPTTSARYVKIEGTRHRSVAGQYRMQLAEIKIY